MKKFLMVFGALSLMVCAIASVALIFALHAGGELDASSKAFALKSIATLSNDWSPASAKGIASTSLTKALNDEPDRFVAVSAESSKLGPMKTVDEIAGGSKVNFNFNQGGVTGLTSVATASYRARVQYANSAAIVSMCLVMEADKWRLNCFSVDEMAP